MHDGGATALPFVEGQKKRARNSDSEGFFAFFRGHAMMTKQGRRQLR